MIKEHADDIIMRLDIFCENVIFSPNHFQFSLLYFAILNSNKLNIKDIKIYFM